MLGTFSLAIGVVVRDGCFKSLDFLCTGFQLPLCTFEQHNAKFLYINALVLSLCFYVTSSVLRIPQSDEDRLFTTTFSFIYLLLTSYRWGWNIGHGGLTKHYGMPLFGVCMR